MADVVDLNGIKNEIKTLLDAANILAASPVDLSNSMTKRVQKVLTLNPEMIQPQQSYFNFVTVYVKSKSINSDQISQNQLQVKRESQVNIEIMGVVFNQNLIVATDDPADTDINYLMENIELILRSSPTLNGKVKWQKPDDVTFFGSSINKANNVRCGLLTLTTKVYY